MTLVSASGAVFDWYTDGNLDECERCNRRTGGKLRRRYGMREMQPTCKACVPIMVEIRGRKAHGGLSATSD